MDLNDLMGFNERLAKAPCTCRSPQRPEFKPAGLSCVATYRATCYNVLQCSFPSPNSLSKSSAQEFCLLGFQRERERLKDQDLFIAILGSWSRHAQLAGHTSNDRHIKCYQTAAVRGLVFLMRPHALQSQSVLHNNVAYNASWMQGFCNEH